MLLGIECSRQAGVHFLNLTLAPAMGPHPCLSGTGHSSVPEDGNFRCLVFFWRHAGKQVRIFGEQPSDND